MNKDITDRINDSSPLKDNYVDGNLNEMINLFSSVEKVRKVTFVGDSQNEVVK